jgi:RNA polymerase subunit RPABC4/transcription elongation factor Spt4
MSDATGAYPASRDRIYPRCPVCRSEQYALAVLAFSSGEVGCWACHHLIREDARLVPSGD